MIAATIALMAVFNLSTARAGEVIAHAALTLHGGPGSNFAALATVNAGSKINLLWCNAGATWCVVQYGKSQGWTQIDALRAAEGSSKADAAAPAAAEASASASAPSLTSPSGGAAGVSASTPATIKLN